MNKTVTANISGVVFHIEANAYEKLHNYLNTIRKYFHDSDGTDEIMADIESRIAELFGKALENGKEVVTMANVNEVIEIMGEPEAYMPVGDEEEYRSSQSSSTTSSQKFYSKKLYRDEDDNLIGGVCSGIGYYFGIDKIWLRALFLIAFFGFGTGFILYIILWIIIPSAKTTAEKLEMKGEPINVDSIGNAIKDEFSSFKKKVNDGEAARYGSKAKNGVYRFFEFLGRIIYYAGFFIIKLIAVILVIAALTSLVAFVGVLLGGPMSVNLNDATITDRWFAEYAELFFASDFMYQLGLFGISLVVLIPILGLLYGGLKMLFKIPTSTKAVGLTAASLWVVGLILMFVSGSSTARQFSSEKTYAETIQITDLESDTIRLAAITEDNGFIMGSDEFYIEGDSLYLDNLSADVVKSKTDEIELYIRKESRGPSRKVAGELAQNVKIEYTASANTLSFSELVRVPVEDKFRNQHANVSIGLPVGSTIFLERSSDDFIYDIENVTDTYDGDMIGHHWLMTEEGLKCTDCDWLDKMEEEEETSEESETLETTI